MLDVVEKVLDALGVEEHVQYEVVRRDQHSNPLAEIHFDDGRVLAIKRARLPEMAGRFAVSRLASRLIAEHTDVRAPVYLDLADDVVGEPVLAYWWVQLPTLARVWADRDAEARRPLVRSLGAMMRSLHRVPLAGHGPLEVAATTPRSLAVFLDDDLGARLLPAARQGWPDGVAVIERLIRAVPQLPEASPVLVHNDLFDANALCDEAGERVVGVLDFEDALGGPAEADLARTELLHGPLFGHPLEGDWFAELVRGYGAAPDPVLLGFFRAFHLANMGFYAAITSRGDHAAHLVRVIGAELDALGGDASHRELVGA